MELQPEDEKEEPHEISAHCNFILESRQQYLICTNVNCMAEIESALNHSYLLSTECIRVSGKEHSKGEGRLSFERGTRLVRGKDLATHIGNPHEVREEKLKYTHKAVRTRLD